jgi:2-keto-3-deoxy-L-rhamnonate aldolase RhmA
MGFSGGDGHEPQFVQALEKVAAINKKLGKVTGIFAGTEESSAEKSKMGFDFLLNDGDATYLAKGAADCLAISRAGVRAAKI